MNLSPGDSAAVQFPPRKRRITARLLRIEPNGDLTFVHPRNGGLRTVPATAVSSARRATPAPTATPAG